MLGPRALGRAALERQLLLRRAGLTVLQAIEHLAGMQSQAPQAPYAGLWTRLASFRPEQLATLMTERAVVRGHLMRNTVHLVTARDFLAARELYDPVLAKIFASSGFARNLAGVDLEPVLAAGRELLAGRPRTRAEIGRLLGAGWPGRDPISLAYAITHLEPVVQVPARPGRSISPAQPERAAQKKLLGGSYWYFVKTARAVARRNFPGSPFNNLPEPVRQVEQYSLHDRVTHDKYGLGVVIGVEEEVAVLIDFGTQRERITSPYSKLTKL